MAKILITNYTYDETVGSISFDDYTKINYEGVLLIAFIGDISTFTPPFTHTIVYNFATDAPTAPTTYVDLNTFYHVGLLHTFSHQSKFLIYYDDTAIDVKEIQNNTSLSSIDSNVGALLAEATYLFIQATATNTKLDTLHTDVGTTIHNDLATTLHGDFTSANSKMDSQTALLTTMSDILSLLKRMVVLVTPIATVDSSQRQKVSVEAFSPSVAVTTVTSVGGMDREMYINKARIAYNNGIRNNIITT